MKIQQESDSDNVTDTRDRSRSKEARERSLWGMGRGLERHRLAGVNKEETKSEEESNFSYSNDSSVNENPIEIDKEVKIILEPEFKLFLREFSNIIIIIIAVSIFSLRYGVKALLILARHLTL